jgi:hypothetical protein
MFDTDMEEGEWRRQSKHTNGACFTLEVTEYSEDDWITEARDSTCAEASRTHPPSFVLVSLIADHSCRSVLTVSTAGASGCCLGLCYAGSETDWPLGHAFLPTVEETVSNLRIRRRLRFCKNCRATGEGKERPD